MGATGLAAPAIAADTTVTIDPTIAGESVSANGAPVTLPAGATSLVIKLPADSADIVARGITSLDYFLYNGPNSSFMGGAVNIDLNHLTVTVPIPANFAGHAPADMTYCKNSFNVCGNDPTATHYTGYRVVVESYEDSGTTYLPIFASSGLIQGTGAGAATVPIDLSAPTAVTNTYYAMNAKTATLAEASDKLIIKAPTGYFTTGPAGTWSGVSTRARLIGGFGIDGDVALSANGATAVVTVKSSHMWYFCQSGDSDLELTLDGNKGGKTAVTNISVGAPACTQSFSDVPVNNQFYKEIQWLANKKITTGYSGGLFLPLNSVNRDAMAAFMYRMAGEPSFTAPAISPFADLKPSDQFYKEITWLAHQGISTGWDEGSGIHTYRPVQAVNRDAMAAFLYRFSGKPAFAPPASSPFHDIATDNPFYKEITWLAAQGISTGYADATFQPVQPVNRDAMAAFLYREDTWNVTRR